MNKLMCFAILLVTTTTFATDNVVVVLDNSSSMAQSMSGGTRMTVAKKALSTVLGNLKDDVRVGVVLLNPTPVAKNNWLIPLGQVNPAEAVKKINELRENGGTPLGYYMKVGADALLELRAKEHYGNYRLLVVTDGEANSDDAPKLEAYLPDIQRRGIAVDVIGLDMRGEHSLATKVASYRRGDDPASLTKAIAASFSAETSANNQGSAGETDFELLAGLQSDVASAIVKAVTSQSNQPIGEKNEVKQDEQGRVVLDNKGQVVIYPMATHSESEIVFKWVFGVIIVFFGLFVFGLFIGSCCS